MTIFRLFKYTIYFVIIAIQFGLATTYYVDGTSGNDSNPGTSPSSAWKSISKVNSFSFKPGDNIFFKRGSSFSGQLTVGQSGSSGYPITFADYGTGNRPILNGNGGKAIFVAQNYITLQNLHVTNGGITFSHSSFLTLDSLLVDKAPQNAAYGDHVYYSTIKNCTFENTVVQSGVYIAGPSADIVIEHNVFANNPLSGLHFNDDGAGAPVRNVTIRYNKFMFNSQYGIGNTSTRNCDFYYNIFYDNNVYGIQFERDVSSGLLPDSNRVYNNLFYNTHSGPSVYLTASIADIIVKNNIFLQGPNQTYLVNDASSDNSNIFSNNIYHGSGTLWYKSGAQYSSYSSWASASGDINSLTDDPQVVDQTKDDFHLQNGSPAIGAGVNVGLTSDFDGNAVSAVKPDIGCFQYIKEDRE